MARRRSPKPCRQDQERNPNTNRCVLKCKNGYERNPNDFKKCRKSCVHPQVRNPSTGRCKKPSRSRRTSRVATRRNPVRLVRRPRSPSAFRECPVCLNETKLRTFCTSGRRHPLCLDCYYGLLQTGIHYCPTCREHMDRRPAK
jgi:hypothetical protein